MNNIDQEFIATAFISCSLRDEDKEFIEYVEEILISHKIKPIGTVGYYSAAPVNTAELMKKNIPLADFVVIIATPRYIQKDIKNGNVSYGLSEMVHVETGMAYMANKPVVVFVQEGTNIGNFLPNVTQYVTLNGELKDLEKKWDIINSLLKSTYDIVRKIKDDIASKNFLNLLTKGLAIYGSFKLIQSVTKKRNS